MRHRARIVSWNVGGLRAAARKGFSRKMRRLDPEIVAIQEVRARPEQLGPSMRVPRGFAASYVAAQRPGYSGVGLWSRREPDEVETSLGDAAFDAEARMLVARFGRLVLASVYVPNGNGKDRDNSRVPYKLEFSRALFDHLARHRGAGRRVIVMGDFNSVPAAIDLARPKGNRNTSGFLPEEVAEVQRWLTAGWVDTFRAFESGPGHYTWWSTRGDVRARNIGWRIDLALACPAAMRHVTSATIHPRIFGSDHCPISLTLEPSAWR